MRAFFKPGVASLQCSCWWWRCLQCDPRTAEGFLLTRYLMDIIHLYQLVATSTVEKSHTNANNNRVRDAKKRQIWQIYLCYSFLGGANFWTIHWKEKEMWALNLVIDFSLNSITIDLMQSIQPILNIIVVLLSFISVVKYLLICNLQNLSLLKCY